MQEALSKLLAGRRGHFRMESGYHSDTWYELDRVFADSEKLRPCVTALAERLAPHRPRAVCGPKSGGAKLAELIAAELGAAYLYTERREPANATGLFPVRYELPAELQACVAGETVAVVDDAISAGSAVRGTHATLIAHGARPVALGALIVFGDNAARLANELNLPLEGLVHRQFNLWLPEQCPLCRLQVALEAVSDDSSPPSSLAQDRPGAAKVD
jgi:orotate phosphoribosyltransferase